MECPLSLTIKVYQDNTTMERLGDCLEGECAYWDESHKCCGERTKRLQLERIADALKDIKNKLNPELFRTH